MKDSTDQRKPTMKELEAQIKELKAKEAVHNHIMQVAPVGLCYLDTNLRYVQINEWLADINGLPAEEHIGCSIRELFPDLADGIEPQFQQVIETGHPIIRGRVYAETRTYPGVKRLFEHNYFADKSIDGAVVGISCFVEEIGGAPIERPLSKRGLTFAVLVDALLSEEERLLLWKILRRSGGVDVCNQ